ncbi:DUF975 family protein [Romboutsia sp. MSSM.1001216sp_RTP31141st1_G3_RTP31141_220114]|uniref:DUF975 family protein n=1 Tax=unclassified Romboutsia TaxID=2626894 RepID=UPI0031B5A110
MKLFNLIEESFINLFKVSKKVWFIGIIITILSGGLILQKSYDFNSLSDITYNEEYSKDITNSDMIDQEIISNENEFESGSFTFGLGSMILILVLVLLVLFIIGFIISLLVNIAYYYLYYNLDHDLFTSSLNRAPLGLVTKVNAIVLLKIIGGTILFVIPGIIIGLKYAPVNYVLCKNPNMSSKEILEKTRKLSKGFKWKIFIYNVAIGILGVIAILLCSPNMYVNGYIWIDVISMLLSFVILTLMTVYTGIFNINLYKKIYSLKEEVF